MKKKFYYKRTSKKSYIITISASEHGTITGPAVAYYGDKVTLTITPDSGYLLDTLKVMCDGKEISVTDGVFTMPDGNVEITATFKVIIAERGFSISATEKIYFAPGNLLYTLSTKKWKFAEHLYDMIGTDNIKEVGILADKVDLFSWSTNKAKTAWGMGTTTNLEDYAGDFVDWGKNIGDGNTWRTLTNDELKYLLNTRTNAENLKGVARINLNDDGSEYVNGLILLPDNWVLPSGVVFKSGFSEEYSIAAYAAYQTFTLDQWEKLELAGAVFLPAAGHCSSMTMLGTVQKAGLYWTATTHETSYAFVYIFGSQSESLGAAVRSNKYSVRLVKRITTTTTYKVTVSTVNGAATTDKTQYAAGETVTITATPSSGYELSSITVNGTAITGNTFTMPDSDVSVVVEFYLLNGIKYTASKDIKNDVASTTASGAELVLDKCTYNASTTEGILMYNLAPTEIDASYFEGNTDLTSINIPASIDSILSAAFKGCSNLKSVTISDGLTTIADEAFLGCESLNSITIPNTVTEVGEQAFENCEALTTAIISDNVTWLSHTTFGGCTNLTSVTIGSKVTYVDYYAFLNCSQLTSIYCKAIEAPQLTTGVSPFSGISKTGVLHVPSEALYNYGKWSSALGTGWSIVDDL